MLVDFFGVCTALPSGYVRLLHDGGKQHRDTLPSRGLRADPDNGLLWFALL